MTYKELQARYLIVNNSSTEGLKRISFYVTYTYFM